MASRSLMNINLLRASRYLAEHGLGRAKAVAEVAEPTRVQSVSNFPMQRKASAAELAIAAETHFGARDVQVIHAPTANFRYLVLCTALSTRHARAVADGIVSLVRGANDGRFPVARDRNAEWVVVDVDDTVVHVLTQNARSIYDIEAIWKE